MYRSNKIVLTQIKLIFFMPFNHYVLVNLKIILHKNTKCCLKLFLSAKVNPQKVFLYSLYFGTFRNDFAQKYQRLFETLLLSEIESSKSTWRRRVFKRNIIKILEKETEESDRFLWKCCIKFWGNADTILCKIIENFK